MNFLLDLVFATLSQTFTAFFLAVLTGPISLVSQWIASILALPG